MKRESFHNRQVHLLLFHKFSPGAVCKGQLDGEAKCCEIVFYGLDVGNSVSTRNQEFKQASLRGKMFKLGIT